MSGLTCCACGAPWRLDKPLPYHHDKLHCDTFACSRECGECKDWERAIEEGATPCATGADQKPIPREQSSSPVPGSTRDSEEERGNPPTAEPTKPPPSGSYAEMMKKVKGGR